MSKPEHFELFPSSQVKSKSQVVKAYAMKFQLTKLLNILLCVGCIIVLLYSDYGLFMKNENII